jgi:hypothetical protein
MPGPYNERVDVVGATHASPELQNSHETCDYMGDVSFSDRFELLEPLREEEIQTLRARERATGRAVEAHFSASPDQLAKLESLSVMDRGSHDGKLYVVTAPLDLDSAGAWRIKEKAPPGDFTRMFELRQAPEPVAAPLARAVQSPAAQPGEFTRAFKKPAAAPAAAQPMDPAQPGEQGEFTRMFQKPLPQPPMPASQGITSATAAPSRVPVGLIVTAILVLSGIAVFLVVRTLY